ncbi:ankyrin [Choiromyces venosus 120613-1]|uniref:Ankyrin n=1 Tax=Choiromyces venosus 120613-1 TaxID=1336337 RepID=A0A3N4IVP8_9PEZI|nr:ankyrin [Choiromyces venosus 120613-1]
MAFLCLPVEIILQIIEDLELSDYYSLLKCNRRLANLLTPTLLKYTLRDPNTRGKRALQLAAERGNIGTVKALVDLGVPSLITRGYHLSYICPNLTPTAINTLLSSDYFSVNAVDTYRQTPLFIAARDNPMAVKCLLGHNAYINAATRALETPLMWASHWDQVEVVRMLLANEKTDVNKRDLLGRSALFLAASLGCVKAKEASPEDPRVNANQGVPQRYFFEPNTPLRAARICRHGEIVKIWKGWMLSRGMGYRREIAIVIQAGMRDVAMFHHRLVRRTAIRSGVFNLFPLCDWSEDGRGICKRHMGILLAQAKSVLYQGLMGFGNL